jgi:hypothetical protein
MRSRRQWWAWAFLLASFALVLQTAIHAKAQDEGDPDDQDPPGRVARLDFSQGAVSFQAAGEGDWVTAVPNRPMVTGDNLWADEDSRAEVHVGSAALRLGAKTGISFLDLSDNATQIRLEQGSLIVRVRHVDDDDTYEVDTPNIAFALLQPGEYRIDVSEDGSQSITTVWHGRGLVTGGGFTYNVVGNQSATFTGSDRLDYDLQQLPGRDDFDAWAFERDAREDQSDSANYVSREMTGYEDLDENGDWSYVAGYGECWRPRAVAAGWAPYRNGHWIWVGRWGWTWVEDEPWGFAPFHYGRWASVNGGWFWVPGPVVVRPVWAPALVAFVGGGPGFHFSAGVGVGWFPLAPGEVFVPGYRVSRTYVNNVNITNTNVNITRVTNVYNTVVINKTVVNNITYVNQRGGNGVTVVSHDAFVNARPVAQNVMRVDAREIAAAPVTHVVQVEPVRQSVIGAGRPVAVRPPAAVLARQVVAQRTPPPPPQSFQQRQSAAGGHMTPQNLVRPEPPARPYQPAPVARPQQPAEGFRPFTPANNAPANNSPTNNTSAHRAPSNSPPLNVPLNNAPPNNGNNPVRTVQPAPRVYEQQGTAEPENRNTQQPENRNMQQPENRMQPNSRPPQPNAQPAPAQHPLVRPTPPVQERNQEQEQQQEQKFHQWQQQRPATPPPAARPATPPAAPKQEKAPDPKKK